MSSRLFYLLSASKAVGCMGRKFFSAVEAINLFFMYLHALLPFLFFTCTANERGNVVSLNLVVN